MLKTNIIQRLETFADHAKWEIKTNKNFQSILGGYSGGQLKAKLSSNLRYADTSFVHPHYADTSYVNQF